MDEPKPVSLAQLQTLARTDAEGNEKQVLSLHDRLFARVLAPPMAWLALKLGLSADFVTALSVITGVCAAAALACPDLLAVLIAAGLLQLSYLLDCADGDVARARGTSSVDGYLRDTLRHYLMNPLVFAGMTYACAARHSEKFVLPIGLLAVFFSTRVVNDLADRVTLDSLLRRLQRGPGTNPALPSSVPTSQSAFERIRALFLPDFAVMNWVTLAAILDFSGVRLLAGQWRCIDGVLIGLGGLQIILKSGGLLLLWIRGVNTRVEKLAQEIERGRRG